jgi:hypothetical protein
VNSEFRVLNRFYTSDDADEKSLGFEIGQCAGKMRRPLYEIFPSSREGTLLDSDESLVTGGRCPTGRVQQRKAYCWNLAGPRPRWKGPDRPVTVMKDPARPSATAGPDMPHRDHRHVQQTPGPGELEDELPRTQRPA